MNGGAQMAQRHNKLLMIRSRKEEGLDDDLHWWEKTGRFLGCRGCGTYQWIYPQPLNAVVQLRQRQTYSFSGRSAYRILKRSFYDFLAPHMPGVVTGEVRFADGRLQEDSVTLNFPPEMHVVLRGGHGSREQEAYRVCDICRRHIASLAMLVSPIHVLRPELPPDRKVLVGDNAFLMLSEPLASELDLSPFPDIKLQPIGIFDAPIEPVPEFGDPEAQDHG
jgi:hypothetical protein